MINSKSPNLSVLKKSFKEKQYDLPLSHLFNQVPGEKSVRQPQNIWRYFSKIFYENVQAFYKKITELNWICYIFSLLERVNSPSVRKSNYQSLYNFSWSLEKSVML